MPERLNQVFVSVALQIQLFTVRHAAFIKNVLQRRAAVKRMMLDVLYACRKRDLFERAAALERADAETRHTVRNRDFRHLAAALECAVTDGSQPVRQRDLLNGCAVVVPTRGAVYKVVHVAGAQERQDMLVQFVNPLEIVSAIAPYRIRACPMQQARRQNCNQKHGCQ